MTVSRRDQKLLMFAAALLIFVGGYTGVYTRYNAKAEAVDDQTAQLAPRLTLLQQYAANESTYRKKMEDDYAAMQAQLAQYPADVRPEDEILFAYDMERAIGLTVSGASLSEAAPFMMIESAKPSAADPAKHEPLRLVVYKGSMSYICTAGYEQIKRAVEYVYASPAKASLDSLSLSYDNETGKLNGTMAIDRYFITGWDDTYRETPVPYVPTGTPNIFRTIPTVPAQ